MRSVTVDASRFLPLVLAGLVAGALPLSAQGHPERHGQRGHRDMPDRPARKGMTGGHGHGMHLIAHLPTALLHQKELLELTDRQVEEIEAVRQEMEEARSHRGEGGSAHEEIASAFGPAGLDVSAYEEALREAARRRIDARVAAARRAQRALEVLDADQRARFLYGLRLMHRMHRMHGMRGGMHGAMRDDGHGGHHGETKGGDGGA